MKEDREGHEGSSGETPIKRLRGLDRSQYRLRADEMTVFYDVSETNVEILAIVTTADAQGWLEAKGERVKVHVSKRLIAKDRILGSV